MKDKISEQRCALLHPLVRDKFKKFIEDAEEGLGITLRIVQGLRTFEEQNELYSHGRTKFFDAKGNKLGVVTKAKAGQGYHNYALAVDLAPIIDGKLDWNFDYSKLTKFMPAGMAWGGNWTSFKDRPHFQMTMGLNWRQMLAKYNNQDFIAGTKYINLQD